MRTLDPHQTQYQIMMAWCSLSQSQAPVVSLMSPVSVCAPCHHCHQATRNIGHSLHHTIIGHSRNYFYPSITAHSDALWPVSAHVSAWWWPS